MKLADGTVLVESGDPESDPTALLRALQLEPPFRALALGREDVWVIGARRIEVVELADDPGGDDVVVVWDGRERSVRRDGEPTLAGVPELERLGASRHDAYVVRATRLAGSVWEVDVAPL